MKIVNMSELENMYGSAGTRFELDDMGVTQAEINAILMGEVADLVEEILHKHIEQDIYGAYQPKTSYYGSHPPIGWISTGTPGMYTYARRGSLNNSMLRKIIGGNTLLVTSDAHPNASVRGTGWSHQTGGFLQMIGTNPGAAWKGRFPRPALQNAQDEVDSSSIAQKALAAAFMRGLKRFTR